MKVKFKKIYLIVITGIMLLVLAADTSFMNFNPLGRKMNAFFHSGSNAVSEEYMKRYSQDSMIVAALGYDSCYVPEVTAEVYRERFKVMKADMPLPYHKTVNGFINLYVNRKRELSGRIVGRSYDYFPLFEQTLEKHGLPKELKNLAVIESALNKELVSPVGAAGLWQFMPVTGREYGLKVNEQKDERIDPIVATDAAARYLKNLYRIYGDWMFAIAAYNCGPGNVNKAIAKAKRAKGRRYKKDIWMVYDYLPEETRGYVPAFIASCYMMNYYNEHNIKATDPKMICKASEAEPVEIKKNVSLANVSQALDISVQELLFLNPDLAKENTKEIQAPYNLKLPIDKHFPFYQAKF